MGNLVSVVIPTYNGSAFLREALASVVAQTQLPREVLIVDDGSTDGTAELAESLGGDAPLPVRVLRLRKNSGGPARPLNVGIEAAVGDFIAVLDQDDLFAPRKLEQQAGLLACQPRTAFVFSCCGRYGRAGETVQGQDTIRQLCEAGELRQGYYEMDSRVLLRALLVEGCFVLGFPGFLFRRSHWEQKGGLDEKLTIAADYDFLCWLSTQGNAAFLPETVYWRRVHAGNMTKRRIRMYLETAQVRVRYLRQARWLLADPALVQRLRDELHTLGYWTREAGEYWAAARFYFFAAKAFGWDWQTALACLKLLPHLLWSKASRRPPVYSSLTCSE